MRVDQLGMAGQRVVMLVMAVLLASIAGEAAAAPEDSYAQCLGADMSSVSQTVYQDFVDGKPVR